LSQVLVTGTIVLKGEKSTVAGINVVEKGTRNGTQTEPDGTFTLSVNDPNAALVFSFIGFVTKELSLKGRKEIFAELKADCNKDFFDSKQVHIYVNSGVINNPIGGHVGIASPWIFHGVIKGSFGYQTNLTDNMMQKGQVELAHYISNCDIDLDFRWGYRKVNFDNSLSFTANSIETDLNFSNLKLIAGYSRLGLDKTELAEYSRLPGLVVGMGRRFNMPLHPIVILKISVYKSKVEYQTSAQGEFKRVLCFLKFYKLDSFNELSLGIGTGFGYRTKKRRAN
jgi:hypothetical protein